MTVSSSYVPTAEGTNAWTSPTNARTHNASFATAAPAKNGSIAGIWKTFGITDLGGTITKVEVGLDWYVSTTGSIATQTAEASYNAGTNWTTAVTMNETDTESHTADGQTEHWLDVTAARSWTWTELNDTNFQVRWTAKRGNSTTAVTFSADVLYVRITYTAQTEAYATEAVLAYNAPTEVYATEAILAYTAPTEAYAAEAILDYTPSTLPCEAYATEAILDYNIPPCEVYATEAILDYIALTEVYAAEAVLDYAVPPCEAYAAEAILDYIAPCEVYASEAILNYEPPPCEVYAAEATLDYELPPTSPCEAYAVEAILDYIAYVPCEAYATEIILDYNESVENPCEVYATEIVLAYNTPAEAGWWGWYAFQFVVHPIRRLRMFSLFGGKQNLTQQPDEEKLHEK